MSRILFLCFFLFGNASQENSTKFTSYLVELLELQVLEKKELEIFLEYLEKNQLIHPIDCKRVRCNSIKTMHRDHLEQYLKSDLNLTHIKISVRKLLQDKILDDQDREETKQDTQSLWKGHISLRIAGNPYQTCAIGKQHELVCWGNFQSKVPKLTGPIKELSASGYDNSNICALEMNGKMQCWSSKFRTHEFVKLTDVTQISAGAYGNYALLSNGTVEEWNKTGNLQYHFQSSIPKDQKIFEISLGEDHVCAIMDDTRVKCWGSNFSKQSTVPEDLEFVEAISLGSSHTCALHSGGKVRCWGAFKNGKLSPPTDLDPVVQLVSNNCGACALQKNGIAKCWDELGKKMNEKLKNLGPLVHISLGHDQLCVVKKNGKVHCLFLYPKYLAFQEGTYTPPDDFEVYIEDLLPRFEF